MPSAPTLQPPPGFISVNSYAGLVSALANNEPHIYVRLTATPYQITSTLVVRSNTELRAAPGVIFQLPASGGSRAILKNKTYFGTEVLIVTLLNATGGTFQLLVRDKLTVAIAYNASAATVQSALRALLGADFSAVTVSGSNGGPWTVTFSAAAGAVVVQGHPGSLTGTNAYVQVTRDPSSTLDHDITIHGIIFDANSNSGNCANAIGNSPGDGGAGLGALASMAGVLRLKIEKCRFRGIRNNAPSPYQVASCSEVEVLDCVNEDVACDGGHLNGPLFRWAVRRNTGSSTDDGIAVQAQDWLFGSPYRGDVVDGVIENCRFGYVGSSLFKLSTSSKSVQTLTGTATGGTFTLSVSRPDTGQTVTTAAIAFNASAATILAALRAVLRSVHVSSASGGALGTAAVTVNFGIYVPTMTVNSSLSGGTVTPATTSAYTANIRGLRLVNNRCDALAGVAVSFFKDSDAFDSGINPFDIGTAQDVVVDGLFVNNFVFRLFQADHNILGLTINNVPLDGAVGGGTFAFYQSSTSTIGSVDWDNLNMGVTCPLGIVFWLNGGSVDNLSVSGGKFIGRTTIGANNLIYVDNGASVTRASFSDMKIDAPLGEAFYVAAGGVLSNLSLHDVIGSWGTSGNATFVEVIGTLSRLRVDQCDFTGGTAFLRTAAGVAQLDAWFGHTTFHGVVHGLWNQGSTVNLNLSHTVWDACTADIVVHFPSTAAVTNVWSEWSRLQNNAGAVAFTNSTGGASACRWNGIDIPQDLTRLTPAKWDVAQSSTSASGPEMYDGSAWQKWGHA